MHYELTDAFVVRANLDETWSFFSAADNLPAITPPWLRFTVTTPGPIHIQHGTHIEYTIRWAGLPVRWRTRIIDWTPPRQFIDLQLKGPYTLWHHQHTFEPAPEGTLCRDRVLYKIPFGPMGRLLHTLMIRKQLIEIFAFRRKVIAERLGWVRAEQANVETVAVR